MNGLIVCMLRAGGHSAFQSLTPTNVGAICHLLEVLGFTPGHSVPLLAGTHVVVVDGVEVVVFVVPAK